MADNTEDREDKEEGGEGGGDSSKEEESTEKGKGIIIIAAALMLVIGGAGAAYFTGVLDPLLAGLGGGSGEVAEAKPEAPSPVGQATVFYDLPEMLVNLSESNRRSTFLKIRVSLELGSAQDVPKVEAVMPRIIDNFQTYLRELRVEDLKGSAGMYRLREELLIRVGAATAPARVNDVLFKEMLIQ